MDHPSFSIIIPHYNIPDLLMRCLDSIPVQEDIQVIVVDDCSPGADQYVQKYPALSRPYLEFYHTPIGGSAGRARNVGLDHAKGKWLIFIDADDFFVDNMDKILEESRDRVEDILYYNYKVVKNSDLTTPGVRNWYSKYFELYAIDKDESRFRYRFESLVGKLFYRPFVQQHQIRFDETSHSNDVGFSFKCGAYAKTIAIIDKTFFIVTEREGSLAASQFTPIKPSSQEFKARLGVSLKTSKFIDQHSIPFKLNYPDYALSFFKTRPLVFIQFFISHIFPKYPQYAIRIFIYFNKVLLEAIRKRIFSPQTPNYEGTYVVYTMGNKPFISIILPVYQAVDYIGECLCSIAAQDYDGRIECIIIDDDGKDGSMSLVREFINAYHGPISFHIVSHNQCRGAATARNTGIKEASGEYIFFLDSDDVIPPHALSSLAAPLAMERFDVIVGRHQDIGLSQRIGPSLPQGTQLHNHEILKHYLCFHWTSTVWNKLFSASFIRNNSLWFHDGIIFEDDLWMFESSAKAKSLYAVDSITYFYRIREGSVMTATTLDKRVLSLHTLIREMYHLIETNNLKKHVKSHDRLEFYRMMLFLLLRGDQTYFNRIYELQRKEIHKTWRECFICNKCSLHKQIRDFHFALPVDLGEKYLFTWLKIEQNINSFMKGLGCSNR